MEVQNHFLKQMEAIYEGSPWYGKSICRILEGIGPEIAFQRPSGSVHTIAELLAHMISWKQVLINRLEKNGKPKPRQRDSFLTAAYGASPEIAWPNLKQALDDQHRQLMGLLDSVINVKQKTGKLPITLIQGIMQHDLYHLGQIALLKKVIS